MKTKSGAKREKQTTGLFMYSFPTRHEVEGVRLVLRMDPPVRVNTHNVHARTCASRRCTSRSESTIRRRRLQAFRANENTIGITRRACSCHHCGRIGWVPVKKACPCPGTKSQLVLRCTHGVSSSSGTHHTVISFGTICNAEAREQAVTLSISRRSQGLQDTKSPRASVLPW